MFRHFHHQNSILYKYIGRNEFCTHYFIIIHNLHFEIGEDIFPNIQDVRRTSLTRGIQLVSRRIMIFDILIYNPANSDTLS